MKQFPVFLAFFLAGAGVAAFAFWAFQPKAAEDLSPPEVNQAKEAPSAGEPSSPGGPTTGSPAPRPHPHPKSAPKAATPPEGPSSAAGGESKHPASPEGPPGRGAETFPVVRGVVTYGPDSAGLPGVPVRVLRDRSWYAECLTDKEGCFALAAPGPGQWRVAAFPFGDVGLQPGEDLTLAAGESRYLSIVIPGKVELEITGRVSDESGQGIAGVKVTAYPPMGRGRHATRETATDSGGAYAIRGLAVALEKPKPQPPRELRSRGGFPFGYRGFFAGAVSVHFSHPEYGDEQKRVTLEKHTDGQVTVDAVMNKPGWVSGTVVFPGGKASKDAYLTYSIQMDSGGSSGSGVKLDGNRFRIPIKYKGRLVLEEKFGDYRVLNTDLGEVDRSTRKSGVVVRLEVMQYHDITFVDSAGQPVGRGRHVWAYIEGDGMGRHHFDDLEMEGNKVRIPVPLKETVYLRVSGEGVKNTRVKLEPGNLPSTITVEFMVPLMTGTVRFPAGFKDYDSISLRVETRRGSGGSGATSGGFNGLDRKTGAFTIHRPSGSGENVAYTVVVTIPGYQPWKKAGFTLKEGETLENVEMTFKK